MQPLRRNVFIVLLFSLIALSLLSYLSPHHIDSYLPFSSPIPPSLSLGFLHQIYVISLPNRIDRRTDINRLMKSLEVSNWDYHDGTYANSSIIKNILLHVQDLRRDAHGERATLPFSWPEECDTDLFTTGHTITEAIPYAGSELWPKLPDSPLPKLLCADGDFGLDKYTEGLDQWRYLTPARVAAYHSHLTAIRRIVDNNYQLGVDLHREAGRAQDHIAMILEDDIDIEIDIAERMRPLMPLLPYNWDIMFLGFCWSDETEYPPLGDGILVKKNELRQSSRPKCSHAYALSPAGAVRLLYHLRNPPFAYGRSVDLASEKLVIEKRLNSYTVVPPVIVQRKVTKTDITLVGGDIWKEGLENGVLGTKWSGDEV